MKRVKRAVVAGLLLLILPVFLILRAAHGHREQEVTFSKDILYGHGGATDLKLDLAMPKTGIGPFPVIVFLHGGGWRGGNRQELDGLTQGAARLGFVAVTVEYRLVPAAQFPAQIEDCKAAVRWLRANSKQYHADPNRFAAVGMSAGAHLACLLGVTNTKDGLEGSGGNPDQSSRVQAVVSFFGPTDFTTRDWSPELEKQLMLPFLGGSFAEKPDAYKRASPITYVTKNAPPFLFFHGTKDALVPFDQSNRLAAKLKENGVYAKVVIYEGEGHGFSNAKNQDSMKEMLIFLKDKLK